MAVSEVVGRGRGGLAQRHPSRTLRRHTHLDMVQPMFSVRFRLPVVLTRHSEQRMAERLIDADLLLQVIDEGTLRYSDATHLWAWLEVPGREDNLICAAVVLEDRVVVKTVMHRWELLP